MSVGDFLRKNRNSAWARPLVRLKRFASRMSMKMVATFPGLYTRNEAYQRNQGEYQKAHWKNAFLKRAYDGKGRVFGWGKIEDEAVTQKRYERVKALALAQFSSGDTIMDIGCYDGFWEAHFLEKNPVRIHCVDVFDDAKELLYAKFGKEKIHFYLTRGDELTGVESGTIDFIFSMDSLVRAEPRQIENYFSEFRRVLKKTGKVMIHLPCTSSEVSNALCFSYLTLKNIEEFGREGFHEFTIDQELISHGVIFMGAKPRT